MKRLTCFFLVLVMLLVQSCAENDLSTLPESTEQQFRFSTKALGSEAGELTHLNAYLFSSGKLVKIIPDLLMSESTVTINMPADAQVYFLAGFSTPPTSLNALEINKTTLNAFLTFCADPVAEAQAGTATLFYTGHYDSSAPAGEAVHEIAMKRSVARLDVNTSSDPLIKINRIIATGVPLSGVLFADEPATAGTIATGNTEKVFATPVSGLVEGLMYLFAHSSPISFTLYGTYDEMPFVVNASIASIKRNTIYTIKVNNIGGSITGSLSIAPWEEGETVEGRPDLNQRIAIDLLQTSASEGMVIDEKTNHIIVSEKGGELALALSTETALTIASTEGSNPLIAIGNPTTASTSNKLTTTIPITIKEQEKGRLPYQVKISLKSTELQNPYDYVIIDVEGNRDQIPTVSFAGLELMAFNTNGSQLSEQYYLPEGVSVLEAYTDHWAECTGRMFQYGRTPGYFPNETMTRQPLPSFTVWNDTNGAPCPDGFRMPTSTELHRLFPQNKSGIPKDGSVPIPYLIDGKPAELKIIVPPKQISMGNIRNITPRYVRLTSEQETIIFPMAGYVNNDNTAGHIGEWFFIIASNRDASYTRAYGYAEPLWKNESSDTQQRMPNNFNFIRCVKK